MSTHTPSFDIEKARFNMIEQQIRPWEVLDSKVLALLGEVKREAFVPEAYRALAFADMEIPLGQPGTEGPCMLAPKVEARILQELALQPHETVLEIGTGSGHMAALMARQCARVISLEIDPALAQQARDRLQQAGATNVEVRTCDAAAHGFAACTGSAPYDVIVLSGSVTDIPNELLDLLKTRGRLFAIVGQEPVMRATLVERVGPASYHTRQPWDTVAPCLQNFPQASGFRF